MSGGRKVVYTLRFCTRCVSIPIETKVSLLEKYRDYHVCTKVGRVVTVSSGFSGFIARCLMCQIIVPSDSQNESKKSHFDSRRKRIIPTLDDISFWCHTTGALLEWRASNLLSSRCRYRIISCLFFPSDCSWGMTDDGCDFRFFPFRNSHVHGMLYLGISSGSQSNNNRLLIFATEI